MGLTFSSNLLDTHFGVFYSLTPLSFSEIILNNIVLIFFFCYLIVFYLCFYIIGYSGSKIYGKHLCMRITTSQDSDLWSAILLGICSTFKFIPSILYECCIESVYESFVSLSFLIQYRQYFNSAFHYSSIYFLICFKLVSGLHFLHFSLFI